MKVRASEIGLLKPASDILDDFVGQWSFGLRQELRFQVLEAVASTIGGFDLPRYFNAFGIIRNNDIAWLRTAASQVIEALPKGVHPALSVSALARENLSQTVRRTSGAYHTDFRLALNLAETLKDSLMPGATIIDPACGAGILLVAATLVACGDDRSLASEWLASSVYASDLSPMALRGTRLSLACFTDDLSSIIAMQRHWKVADSLIGGAAVWSNVRPDGFNAVIANPPWEKLKVTRHEFLKSNGADRQYGTEYGEFDLLHYEIERSTAKSYGEQLTSQYTCLSQGEPDLFIAFTELAFRLAGANGAIGLLLPAGLIRSKGTAEARRQLFAQFANVSIDIFDNKARFFEIDTRFKFLTVHARRALAIPNNAHIELRHSRGTSSGVARGPAVRIDTEALHRVRPDLTLPEVRSAGEWQLFARMIERGHDWSQSNSPWFPRFAREVDMTRDRTCFDAPTTAGALPLVEGRMVHQHRLGAKSYVSGSGRSATWHLNAPGQSSTDPQFAIHPDRVPSTARQRWMIPRVGFCDITGQTNERSLMAAFIPAGVVCGNKVPSILFPNDPGEDRLWLWLAIANSFPFDWLVRRVITTTVNYFHLLSLTLPPVEPRSLPGQRLIEIAKHLSELDHAGASFENLWRVAELRAKADHLICSAYGLTDDDVHLILNDFPLIDRAQPAIEYETKSTVTRDLLMCRRQSTPSIEHRLALARSRQAVPYLPSEFAIGSELIGVRLTGTS